MGSAVIDKHQLRQQKRQLRCAVSKQEQKRHSLTVARRLTALPQFSRSCSVALYFSVDGEVDTTPLLSLLQDRGKHSYYPALHIRPVPLLWFIEYRHGESLIKNRFGIPEPSIRLRQPIKPWALDLVIVPLVAFDARCNRLGMGGGYYDRTFAYLGRRMFWRKPLLIGVAHECQKVERLEREPWDVPLDAVVTERRVYLPDIKERQEPALQAKASLAARFTTCCRADRLLQKCSERAGLTGSGKQLICRVVTLLPIGVTQLLQ